MKQRENESSADYLKRLFAEGDKAIKNIAETKADMKKKGIIGFCSKCGCNRYEGKEHKCDEN